MSEISLSNHKQDLSEHSREERTYERPAKTHEPDLVAYCQTMVQLGRLNPESEDLQEGLIELYGEYVSLAINSHPESVHRQILTAPSIEDKEVREEVIHTAAHLLEANPELGETTWRELMQNPTTAKEAERSLGESEHFFTFGTPAYSAYIRLMPY